MHSRRSFLRSAAAAATAPVLGTWVLAGCTSADDPATGAGVSGRGGTLLYATAVTPDSWDPHVSAADVTGQLLRGVFDSLVSEASDGSFVPWLAKSWHVSPDAKTYTFGLREDVTFSDGTKFDAGAVKANFDHIVAPKTASKSAVALIGPYERTEVVDEFTAAVHLSEPYSSFLRSVSTTYLGFHSPKTLREHPADLGSGGRFTVSTGPFVFTESTTGQQATFTRRDDYGWAPKGAAHSGPAHLGAIEVKILTEDASRVGAITSGQVLLADQIPVERQASVRAQQNLTLVRVEPAGSAYSLYLNTARAPFDDLRARRAVRAALDIDKIVKGVFRGGAPRAWSPLTPWTAGYDAGVENSSTYDRAVAERLLDELGYTGRDGEGYRTKGGKRFRIESPFVQTFVSAVNQSLNVAVQDALKQVGIELALLPMDSAASIERTRVGDYDLFAFNLGTADPVVLRNLFHSGKQFADGGANASKVRDARLDDLLDRAQATAKPAESARLYQQVQARVIEQVYSVPVYYPVRYSAVSAKVTGLKFDRQAWPRLYDVSLSEA